MPIYQCAAPHGLLTADMKARVAAAITDAHVEATGAPRVFMHVLFNELPPSVAQRARPRLNPRHGPLTGAEARPTRSRP